MATTSTDSPTSYENGNESPSIINTPSPYGMPRSPLLTVYNDGGHSMDTANHTEVRAANENQCTISIVDDEECKDSVSSPCPYFVRRTMFRLWPSWIHILEKLSAWDSMFFSAALISFFLLVALGLWALSIEMSIPTAAPACCAIMLFMVALLASPSVTGAGWKEDVKVNMIFAIIGITAPSIIAMGFTQSTFVSLYMILGTFCLVCCVLALVRFTDVTDRHSSSRD